MWGVFPTISADFADLTSKIHARNEILSNVNFSEIPLLSERLDLIFSFLLEIIRKCGLTKWGYFFLFLRLSPTQSVT